MKRQTHEELLSLMDDIHNNMASTVALADIGCTEPEASRYRKRLEKVLDRIEKAKDHVLAARVDAEP